ncbi:MAG: class II aldolase/adducin family protein, partial [Bacillota bacterium]|nr:class II aldolase/adducin family protein [Bacillota bacterium]
AANDGNISVRLSDDEFLVTPTGVSKGFMNKDMIIKVDGVGNVREGNFKPTSEMKMHLRVYQERPEIQAVVHVHPPYATAFAIAGLPLNRATMPESVILLGTIPVARYGTPSTEAVPNALNDLIQDHNGVLLENHGALTWGRDLEQAYFFMETLEFTAKINWIAQQMNGDRELSNRNVEQLLELKKSMGLSGSSPQGISCDDDFEAKKITPPLERALTQQDLKTIVDNVTASVLEELKKIL